MKKKLTSGFTLLELLVVLIIIGILAVIAVPSLFSNVSKSQAAEAFANISSIRAIIESCMAGHPGHESVCPNGNGAWPATANFHYSADNPAGGGFPDNHTGYRLTASLGSNVNDWTNAVQVIRADATSPAVGSVSCGSYGTLAGAC